MPSLLDAPDAAQRERAATHLELAKREAAIVPDIPAGTPLRPVRRAAVIGAGTMGGGIAMSLAHIGIPVVLIDADAAGLERGLARVRSLYAGSVSRGKLDPAGMAQRLACIRGS